jgi:hypothetical protein
MQKTAPGAAPNLQAKPHACGQRNPQYPRLSVPYQGIAALQRF